MTTRAEARAAIYDTVNGRPASTQVNVAEVPGPTFVKSYLNRPGVIAHRPARVLETSVMSAAVTCCGAVLVDHVEADVETVDDFCDLCLFDGDHYVYTFHDANGTPLYVGQTGAPVGRMTAHRSGTPWFGWVAEITGRCVESSTALEVEADLIRELDPPYNVDGRAAA